MTVAAGVHSVVATPFAPDEELDEASMASLADYAVDAGVQGVVVLGVLGEAERLSDAERERVQAGFLAAVDGRVQVTVGISHPATTVCAKRARSAERAGANAVMVAPPAGCGDSRALRRHVVRVAEAVSVPVVVQDLPQASDVRIPVELLASLAAELPPGSAVKVEDPPTPAKIAALREAAPSLFAFGGLGGTAILHELEAGAAGTMTGFALPGLLVEIVEAHRLGDRETARSLYEEALPLLVFEAGVGLAVRKEILRRRRAIAHATLREPAPLLDEHVLASLNELLGQAVDAR